MKQHISREREAARRLRRTQWWLTKAARGVCEDCGLQVGRQALTLDHRVPLARGGRSVQGNVAAVCRPCNQRKGLLTPVEQVFSGGGEL